MKIDTEHLHYWMQAIRNSKDPMRTLDAFWRGQILSKEWLIENLKPFVENPVSVDIHGGWVGTLSSMLFQSNLPIKHIRSIDIDLDRESIAAMMNKKEEMLGMFEAVTSDMCSIETDADIIINTSCEHISQIDYNRWLNNLPDTSLLVLQSNNYKIDEHIRTADNLEEFKKQSKLNDILFSGEFETEKYRRFMIIGKK